MKLSKYVRVIKNGESTILYNTINACIVVQEQIIDDLPEWISGLGDDEIAYLKENDFFIEDDNAKKIFFDNESSKLLYITIMLTDKCNVHCVYCYENNRTRESTISTDIIDKTVQYVQTVMMENKKIERVCFELIGGEPLLFLDYIEYLIKKMEMTGIPTYYFLETNGVLFDEKAQAVMEQETVIVSITLTAKEDQNYMRPLVSGKPSYDRIIQNLKKAEHFFKKEEHTLVLRYNVHKRNADEIKKHYVNIKSELPYLFEVEMAPIQNYSYNTQCDDFSPEEYSKWFLDNYFDLNELDVFDENKFLLSSKRKNVCTGYAPYNLKIYPDGALGLCNTWLPENKRGHIDDVLNGVKKESLFANILSKRLDQDCIKCNDLFLCGGKLICRKDNPCRFVDFDVDEYIKKYVNILCERH